MKFSVSIIILILLFLITDNTLSFYGRGKNLFNNKIIYDYNTDFDPLEGFKIEEEGFIQIIGRGTKIDNNIEVSKILEYTYDSSGIFCKILDARNKSFFVKVQYDKKGKPGFRIHYSLMHESEINKELKWYEVDNSSFVRVLEILRLIIIFITLIISFLLITHLFKK